MRRTERELRAEIVRYGKLLFEKDYAPATSGNISVRLDSRRLLVTPSGVSKGDLKPAELIVVDSSGRKVQGKGKPTIEINMHRLAYEVRPETEAVVHAHPPVSTGFACAGIPLNQPFASEFIQALGCAPLAAYGTPGTDENFDSLRGLFEKHDAVLLANHGAVTFGKGLFDAFCKMELVEHFAKIALVIKQLGQERPLRERDIVRLLEERARYFGLKEVPPRIPECPLPGAPSCGAQTPSPDPKTLERIVEEVLKKLK